MDFVGAKAFSQRKLRKVIKTRKRWMFSWLTGSGVFKDEQFEDDKEKLAEFYRAQGYIDFEIKDVQFVNPTPRRLMIRFIIYEGTQYKVGSVTFSGNEVFTTARDHQWPARAPNRCRQKGQARPERVADGRRRHLHAKGLANDIQAIEDFYGARGYIDVTTPSGNLTVSRIPNTETGTMDLDFKIDEGQKIAHRKDRDPRQHQNQGQGHPPRVGGLAGRRL